MRGFDEDRVAVDGAAGRGASVARTSSGEGLLDLQRTAGNEATVQFLEDEEKASPVLDVVGRGGGAPLDRAVRAHMESRLGHDFGDVRIHTDAAAAASATSVGAHAYTVGNDVVFGTGHYDPASPAGRKTIAHELTHVVQQKAGPVDGTPAPGGIKVSHPGDRFEQEADEVAAHAVQRQDEEMEEEEAPPT